MTWATIWAFIKKVPAWIWFALGTVLSLGLLYRETKRRKAETARADEAEARTERVVEVADGAIKHAQDTANVTARHAEAEAEAVATAEASVAAVRAESKLEASETAAETTNRLLASEEL